MVSHKNICTLHLEQAAFKKESVIMNQVSKQKAKVEKDFTKTKVGKDCRNSIDNCNFKAIYDEIHKISYMQRYASLYFNDD